MAKATNSPTCNGVWFAFGTDRIEERNLITGTKAKA